MQSRGGIAAGEAEDGRKDGASEQSSGFRGHRVSSLKMGFRPVMKLSEECCVYWAVQVSRLGSRTMPWPRGWPEKVTRARREAVVQPVVRRGRAMAMKMGAMRQRFLT